MAGIRLALRLAGTFRLAGWLECIGWPTGWLLAARFSDGFNRLAMLLTLLLNLSIQASSDTVCLSIRRNASESRKRAQRQQHDRYFLMKRICEHTHQ